MKVIVSATLMQKTIKEGQFPSTGHMKVTVKDGVMRMFPEDGDEVSILVTHNGDFKGWIECRAFARLELTLRVLDYEFPLTFQFLDSGIYAEMFL